MTSVAAHPADEPELRLTVAGPCRIHTCFPERAADRIVEREDTSPIPTGQCGPPPLLVPRRGYATTNYAGLRVGDPGRPPQATRRPEIRSEDAERPEISLRFREREGAEVGRRDAICGCEVQDLLHSVRLTQHIVLVRSDLGTARVRTRIVRAHAAIRSAACTTSIG